MGKRNHEFMDEAKAILPLVFESVKRVNRNYDFICKKKGRKYFVECKSCAVRTKVRRNGRKPSVRRGRFWIRKEFHDEFKKLAGEEKAIPRYLFLLTKDKRVFFYKTVSWSEVDYHMKMHWAGKNNVNIPFKCFFPSQFQSKLVCV